MTYRDTFVTCEECDKQFVFTVEKQRQMADQGQEITIPELCTDCTHKVKYGGRLHGRVKWFSLDKGYGFIVQDSGGEIFVHRNSVAPAEDGTVPNLEEGQEVLYEVSQTSKGPQATQVTPYHN
jgi:CspA family cold shock protein